MARRERRAPSRKQAPGKSILIRNPRGRHPDLSRGTESAPEEAEEFNEMLEKWRKDTHPREDTP